MALTKVSSGLISADASSVDLNIDAGTLYIDATNNRVGIGTTSPAVSLDVYGSDPRIQSSNSTATVKNILLAGGTAGYIGMTTNHPLVFITNDTERLRIDSSGNVGIGTSNPSVKLHVVHDSAEFTTSLLDTTTKATLHLKTHSEDSTITSFGGVSGGGAYIQRSNGAGTAAYELLLNPYGGNVGIGTSSNISSPLTVQANQSASALSIIGRNNGTSDEAVISFYEYDGTTRNSYIIKEAGDLAFATGTGGSPSERMRIDSSGNLLVGITSVISSATTSIYKSSLDYGLFIRKGDGTTGSTNKYIGFDISGGGTAGGSITNSSAGNAQFTATSDERLKENIQDISGCLDKVMALKPSSYTLKQNQLNVPYGFIAQNVETVLPEFVSENEEGWKQISDGLTSGYIAVLTKAIQELSNKVDNQQVLIEQLQAEVALLKGE